MGAWLCPDYNDPNRVSSGEQRSPYVAIVNNLCLDTFEELATLAPPQDDPDGMRAYAGGMSDMYASSIQRWSAVELPVPADEPAVRSMLDALERLSIAFADMGASVRSAAGLYSVDECVSLGR